MLTSHTQPVCFACPCHCYYPGTQYFFCQTHETAIITTMVGAFAFLIIRVLSLSSKLTCYFGRGIFSKFYVCGREELYDKTAHRIMIQSLFTAEISDSGILFLNIKKCESERFNRDSILDALQRDGHLRLL